MKEFLRRIEQILKSSETLPLKTFNEILKLCDDYIAANYEKFDLDKIDCKRGCGYCCKVNVSVLEIEAKNIAQYLKNNFKDLKLIKSKLRETAINVKSFDEEERIAARISCPFLNDKGECSIYPVRPILCRSVTSTDHEKCIEALNAVYFDEQVFVMSSLYIKDLYENLFIMISKYCDNKKSAELSYAVYKYVKNDS